ncbi:MAG: long-chain fatty acid--CoA ligase [Saprospirales bacterium]|nr:long-chain fatty acid--CoA ligase [Saprospirales bacterium]
MDFHRLFDILPYQAAKYPQKVALAHKDHHTWKTYSTEESLREIALFSAGFLHLGLKKGDKAAIISHHGSATWNFLDLALQQIGVVVVPIHSNQSAPNIEYILRDAEAKYCFTDGIDLYEKIVALQLSVPSLKGVFTFEKYPGTPSVVDLRTEPNERHQAEFQTYKGVIHEDDLATIIYTSGTTGQPKGVELTHKNIVSNIKSVLSVIPVNCDHTVLSFLPLSHIFERMVTYTYLAVGASLYYAERTDNLAATYKEVRPHYFTAVPLLLERIYEHIYARTLKGPMLARKIVRWSLQLGERYHQKRQAVGLLYWFQLRVADLLVYRLWRKALGGRIQGVCVGAAALDEKLGRLFSAAGITIREGYGLTETSPVLTFNRFEPGLNRFGTVGIPIAGVSIRIDQPDETGAGEIQAKGPNVMRGYHKLPEEISAVFTEDGWFRTGDIGQIVHHRFLQITDRKKDIFKTTSGKFIAPKHLENKLQLSPFIDQCMVIGFNKPFVVALILPNFPLLELWCNENHVHWTAPQYMVINPKVEKFFQSIVDQTNEDLVKHEKIRNFLLLHENWSIEQGELTPTLKLIRSSIEKKFGADIEKLYASAK